MSEHTPYVEQTVAADCVYGDCEHEGDCLDECPHIPKVLCQGCMDEVYALTDDEPIAVEWPCIHTTRTGREEGVKRNLLALIQNGADDGRES